jgi:hypothetical protein
MLTTGAKLLIKSVNFAGTGTCTEEKKEMADLDIHLPFSQLNISAVCI